MTPESLKKKLAESSLVTTLLGEPIRLRKISTPHGIALQATHASLPRNELEQPVGDEAMFRFFSEVLSYSIVDDGGNLPFNSDEGRLALLDVPLDELVDVAEQSLKHSGLAGDPTVASEAKKNLTPTNCSAGSSPEPSDGGTTSVS